MNIPRTFLLLAAAVALTASSLTCQSTAVGPTAPQADAIAVTEAAFNLALTQKALGAIQTARALPTPTSPPPGAHSPEITSLDFPTSIPADGTSVRGSIKFVDGGVDMNSVSIEALEGNFASSNWDPTGTITWTGPIGVVPFETRCTEPQAVRARAVLRDSMGSASIHWDFSYTCQ